MAVDWTTAEKVIVRLVGDRNERASWVVDYSVEPVYSDGHRAKPYLALAIWADASKRFAAVEKPFADDQLMTSKHPTSCGTNDVADSVGPADA
jgi:hypothetical protein